MRLSIEHVRRRAIIEAKRMLLRAVYLWALFSLFALHKAIFMADESVVAGQIVAVFNALIFAKVLYVGERLRIGEVFQDKPLIYPVLARSASFAILLVCFHVAEEMVVAIWRGQSISENLLEIGKGNPLGILFIGVIMFVVLIPFFAFRELGRVIGNDELYGLFLVRRSVDQAAEKRMS